MKRPPFIRFLMVILAVFALSSAQSAMASGGTEGAWAEKSAFISPETVVVGCGAGLTAGVFAAALPAIAPLPGQATLVTAPILTAWGLIGCGVGVVAGLSAVLTQGALDAMK